MDKLGKPAGLRVWDLAPVFCVAAAVVAAFAIRQGLPVTPKLDALNYIKLALGLAEFGTFGDFSKTGSMPGLSHESSPLYPAFLALLMKLDPALRTSLICVVENDGTAVACPASYWTVVIAQGALMVVLAVSVWLTTWFYSERRAAAWLAMVAVLSCSFLSQHMRLFLTEALLLPLCGLFTLVLLLLLQRQNQIIWPLLAGVVLGFLALARPTFTYVFWLLLFTGLFTALLGRHWRVMRAGLIAFIVAYSMLVLPWMARNHIQFGEATLNDSSYGGRALSHRLGYNQMTATEWGVAFIYWFPDFGDRLAERLFPPHTYERLGWSETGFFQIGARDVSAETLKAAGSPEKHLDYLLRHEVLANPVKHLLVSLPLAWRAMFVNNYWGIIGWICCVWLLWRSACRREWTYWVLCLPPFFLLAFHAAVSVSITRYSIPLIPILSLAMGVAFLQLGTRLSSLKSRFRQT